MWKTQKAVALSWLEAHGTMPEHPASDQVTLAVVDLIMILRIVCTDTSQCSTLGEISDVLFTENLNLGCKYTVVVSDNYTNTDSINSGQVKKLDVTEYRCKRSEIQVG